MASRYQKLDNVGQASIFKGDPRLPETDMDGWYRVILETHPPRIETRPYLYGSDAGFCARRNVLLEHNTWLDANTNAAGLAYMAIGVALENLLATSLDQAGKLVVQGRRIVGMPSLKISGKMDLIIFDSLDRLALVEVKTCGELPVEPKPAHLAQVQTYAAVTGIDTVYLTYMSRNLRPLQPIPMRTFVVDTSRASLQPVLQTAALSRLASDQHVLPPTPAHFRKHTECHYCEFRDYFCHGARPGLGGAEPVNPLQELDTQHHTTLLEQSARLATELWQGRDVRYLETLQDLCTYERLAPSHLKRLRHMVQDAKVALVGGEGGL